MVCEHRGWSSFLIYSPDGGWILYTPLPAQTNAQAQLKLMRTRINGKSAELVLTTTVASYGGMRSAKAPSSFCAIAERTSDRKQLTFTALDPVKRRGRELTSLDIDPSFGVTYLWDLSLDGRQVAILRYSEGQIHILSLAGQPSQQIDVQGWKNLQSVGWASDGKNLFVSSLTSGSSVLLQVDVLGRAHVLWEQKGGTAPAGRPWDEPLGGPSAPWAVPSPDDRHLAIYTCTVSSNMWMMENF
jgi:hypothetical protein